MRRLRRIVKRYCDLSIEFISSLFSLDESLILMVGHLFERLNLSFDLCTLNLEFLNLLEFLHHILQIEALLHKVVQLQVQDRP